MKYLKLLLTLIFIIPISGCYNYRELNDLGITTAIGISKDGDMYKLVVEVLQTEKKSNDEASNPSYVLFETEGNTIQEAVRNTILESSKRLYVNHLSLLIIDESLAKDGIKDIMDLFFRDSESRKQFYVLVSKEPIKELLETKTPLDSINSKSIEERLKSNDKYLNNVTTITFSKLLNEYVNPYKEIVIPVINIKEDKIIINESAIFKNDKLIGYIDNDDTLYLNFIKNNVDDTIITLKNNNKYSSIEMNFSHTDIDVNKNNITINLKMSGNITEINNNLDLTNPNSINYLEKIYEEYLNSEITKMIYKIINEYGTDIFGFKDLIYKKDYQYFNDNLKLKDLNIKVNTKINLKFKGNGATILHEN